MIVNDLNITGISTVVMNYCINLNKSKFIVTIISGAPVNKLYKDFCLKSGIELVVLPKRKTDTVNYYCALWGTLKIKRFDIVHIHGNSATMAVELFISYLCGIKIRIAHCHNSTCNNQSIHKILSPLFKWLYTDGFACSILAGKWLFRKGEFEILPNGFEVNQFEFSRDKRKRMRNELNVENSYVIGHIGRFNDQKNQLFILEVFREYAKLNDKAVLLLVGTGPNYEIIKKDVNDHQYKDRIILYGETTDTPSVYSAMDLFIFPSKYEGLGIVAVEAQINGLPCIASQSVPVDVAIGNDICFCGLDDKKRWIDFIKCYENGFNTEKRLSARKEFYSLYIDNIEKYNIKNNVDFLEHRYQELYRESRKK